MTDYLPKNAKLEKLVATNARVQDLLDNRDDKTDGWIWHGAFQCAVISGGTAPVLTRNAQGDVSWNRTGGGAETMNFFTNLILPARLTAEKGMKLTDVAFVYQVTTVDATTITPVVDKVTYADGVAPVVASFGGTLGFSTAYDTNAERVAAAATPKVVVATLGTPVFQSTDLVAIQPELQIVIASGTVLRLYGFGFHFTNDYL